MPLNLSAGEKIKKLRELKGISQHELAEAINVSNSAITNYEANLRVPRDEIKKKIALYFGKTVQEIFFE